MAVATAISTEPKPQTSQAGLWTTGLVGGAYILGALAVVFYGVPNLWDLGVSPWLAPSLGGLFNAALRALAQLAAAAFLIMFGINLAPNPPRGARGSIFLCISAIFAVFFLVRGALAAIERLGNKFDMSQVLALIIIGVCFYFFFRFVRSDRMMRWSIILESAGWFDLTSYKRNQGTRVRRLTVFGLILLFGAGVYTMWHNRILADGDISITIPFAKVAITVLTSARLTVGLILMALTFWFSWRLVNYPVFADFLIATEAEINKVSWTPRARLIQDTIVVLTTVVIITLFLFVVDVFWGWILSRDVVRILPTDQEQSKSRENSRQVNTNEY